MNASYLTRAAWILLVGFVLLIRPTSAEGLNYYWGRHPDKERLVFVFPGPVPKYSLTRTEAQGLSLILPPGYWSSDATPPSGDFAGAKLLKNVTVTPQGLKIDLGTTAFGYMHFPMNDRSKLVLDVFEDPIGAKWRPAETPPPAVPAPEPQPGAPASPTAPMPATPPPAVQTPAPQQGAVKAPVGPAPATPAPPAQESSPPSGESELQPGRRNLFSVPYTYRAPIKRSRGPESAPAGPDEPNAPAPPARPDSSEAPTEPRWEIRTGPSAPATLEAPGRDSQLVQEDASPQAPAQLRQSIVQPGESRPVEAPGALQAENTMRTRVIQPAQQAPQPSPEKGPPKALSGPAPGVGSEPRVVTPSSAPIAAPAASTPTPAPPSATPKPETSRPMPEPTAPVASAPAPLPPSPDAVSAGPAGEATKAESKTAGPESTAGVDKGGALSGTQDPGQGDGLSKTTADAGEAAAPAPGEPGQPEPPATPEELIIDAKAAVANENFAQALELLGGLKNDSRLSKEQKEEVYYLLADALYAEGKDALTENYGKIVDAYNQAMNFNLASMRVPDALFHLGLVNLKAGNVRVAESYFNILKEKYPQHESIPHIFFQMGEYFFQRGQYQEAADQYQYVVQRFPDNKLVREASVGLARCLYNLELMDQAYQIVDYLEKRWPRFYIEYPPLLRLVGDVNLKTGHPDKARLIYWTYYNIDPTGSDADVILARLGDIYLQGGHKDAAKEVYEHVIHAFPDREGSLIAQMRLAEQGIYDEPTVADMFSVFDKPFTLKPYEVYTRIVKEHPKSDLAPLAQLKLAIWYLFNQKFGESLGAVTDFLRLFPQSKLARNARDVGLRALGKLVAQMMKEQNYAGVARLWDEHPDLQTDENQLDNETKLALANSFWKQGEAGKALGLVEPFFQSSAMPPEAENALLLALDIALNTKNWKKIVDLGNRVSLWELTARTKDQLDYNLALAYENMDEPESSEPLWEKLAARADQDPVEQGYALFFLAQASKARKDYKAAYDYAQSSLTFFLESQKDKQKIKELLRLLLELTETTGRARESLKWAIDYAQYVNKGDPEWPDLRYRMATIYRKLGDLKRWRTILEELVQASPNSLFGRLADTDLKQQKLEEQASQFTGSVNF